MAKRPSLLANIDMEVGKGGAEEKQTVVAIPKQQNINPSKIPTVKSTVYFPPAVHQKLREIAFAKNCKVHDLVLEGLSYVLEKNGFPSVDELK